MVEWLLFRSEQILLKLLNTLREQNLLFAGVLCGFDLRVLPVTATLTMTSVVYPTDTAHESYDTTVVVGKDSDI